MRKVQSTVQSTADRPMTRQRRSQYITGIALYVATTRYMRDRDIYSVTGSQTVTVINHSTPLLIPPRRKPEDEFTTASARSSASVWLEHYCTVARYLNGSSWFWYEGYQRGRLICIRWMRICQGGAMMRQ